MSLRTRNVPIEEVQRIQESLWRQSSAVKVAIRDAASRVSEHIRSRETFLLEQVELLERAKFEMLMENLLRAEIDLDDEEENDVKEAILEFATMQLGVEQGLRKLCEAIANFGPNTLKETAKETKRHRSDSVGSLGSDFCVLDDEVVVNDPPSTAVDSDVPIAAQEITHAARFRYALLENLALSEWLLHEDEDANANVGQFSFFGEFSRYARDYDFWLLRNAGREDKVDEIEEAIEMDEAEFDSNVGEDEEEEIEGWEKWLHPASTGAANTTTEAFFSEYTRFLLQSSAEDWTKDSASPEEEEEPVKKIARSESSTTDDFWLLKTRINSWHVNHPHHYGECAVTCPALPDENAMEIENLGNLTCIVDGSSQQQQTRVTSEDDLSQWLLNPKKGKAKVTKGSSDISSRRKSSALSAWLLEEGDEEASLAPSPPAAASKKKPFDVADWLKRTEEDKVKELCRANESCSVFAECLFDINCKKGKVDDEEKEKGDEKEDEKESEKKTEGERDSLMDADSGEWVLPKKDPISSCQIPQPEEDKVDRIMRRLSIYQSTPHDYWLTS